SQEREDYNRARASFGDDLFMVVACVSDDAFAPKNVAKLRALHQQIEAMKGVTDVISLVNSPYARGDARGASIEKLLPENAAPERRQEAKAIALSDKLYAGQIVSRDGKTAAINLLLKPELTTEQRYQVTSQVYSIAQQAGFSEVFFAGDPFMQWRGVEAIRRDLSLFLPLTILLVAFLLWLCFRALVAVVLPLLTVGIGLLWVFGLMAHIGSSFNLLSMMLPTVLLAIGCSYIIHVFNQIGLENLDCGMQTENAVPALNSNFAVQILTRALDFISLPVIVSALTIIAGFLSLAFTKIPGIRSTAIYAALGAASTMILSLTFVPAVLALLGPRVLSLNVGWGGPLVAWLGKTGRTAVSKETHLYLVTGVMCVLSVAGIFRLLVNVDYYGFFKANTEAAIGTAEVGKRLAGAISVDVIVEGDRSVATPSTLAKIAELQTFAEAASQGQSLSVGDFVKHGNRAFHENKSEFYALPTDEKILRELMSDREQLRKFIADDDRKLRILVRSPLSGSAAMSQAVEAIEAKGRELLPGLRVYVTGTVALMNRTSDMIAREQVQSIAIALLTIYVMLSLLFKSWRVGITALVPNLIPVLFFFGYMGWSGTPLNMTTSLVASVVLGLAVDNAVQFIVRFRSIQPSFGSVREAIVESMRLSGRPIIYANVAIAAAFAVFALSNFWPVATFGILSAVTILGCLVEDLVLLPARLTSPIFRATSKKEKKC
ncbi:MAG TPA: MMPL family transporter, partial [Blastocatellia bacterium]|nr:MMPL family transporter [Blastocatellia bacterium]